MTNLIRDLRYAMRSLLKTPQFTIIAILTLGLGVGANTAIFSLLDHLQFRNIAVREPHRLVRMDLPGPFAGAIWGGSYCMDHPMFRDFQKAPKDIFSGVAGVFSAPVSLSVKNSTERGNSMLVSGNAFEVFGLAPAAGRLLTPADDETPGAHPVVVLSYGYWQRRFGGSLDAVGETIRVNNQPMTVVGVAPEGFRGTDFAAPADVFVPMRMKTWVTPTWDALDDPSFRWLQIFARLADGVTREAAEEKIQVMTPPMFERYLAAFKMDDARFRDRVMKRRLLLQSAGNGFSPAQRQTQKPLYILMALVACVLLIACANISGLLIARFLRRERELAIRLAMGAGTGSILRLTVMESVLLALGGAATGLAIAEWFGRFLVLARPVDGLDQLMSGIVDLRVLLFTLAVTAAVALLFSLAPLLSFNLRGMVPALRHSSGSISGTRGGVWLRKALVVGQIAISLPVMLGAALFVQTFQNLRNTDLGVRTENIVQFNVDPLLNGYSQERIQTFYQQLQAELRAYPGVDSVGMASVALFSGDENFATMTAIGEEPPSGQRRNVALNRVNPGYFATMGIPQLLGRPFLPSDQGANNKVAVISQETAKRFFGEQNPLGRQMCFGLGKKGDRCLEIVGVVKDSKQGAPREETPALFYTAYSQADDAGQMTIYLRGQLPPEQLFQAARTVVGKLDANLPVFDMMSMETQIAQSLVAEMLISYLSGGFGMLSTLLAALGLYGVMAYLVVMRTKEIGVRMALGAHRLRVVGLILRDVGLMVAVGVAVALPLCYGVGRAIEADLFGVKPWDLAAIAASAVILLGAALVAGLIPAAMASRINPMVALRNE
jgi:predicted permease